jgi:DNA-binding response OmpR family regulator
MPSPLTILVVEDNPDDAALTRRALRERTAAEVQIARSAREALDYLFDEANSVPRVVLLDLGLPSRDGLEVLRRIREDERTCMMPVVILTSSSSPSDIAAGYRCGANSYICKPVDFDEFADLIRQLGAYWLAVNEPPPNRTVSASRDAERVADAWAR